MTVVYIYRWNSTHAILEHVISHVLAYVIIHCVAIPASLFGDCGRNTEPTGKTLTGHKNSSHQQQEQKKTGHPVGNFPFPLKELHPPLLKLKETINNNNQNNGKEQKTTHSVFVCY